VVLHGGRLPPGGPDPSHLRSTRHSPNCDNGPRRRRRQERCPLPSNLRDRAALVAGVLQVGGTESGRVCPIPLTQITASLAAELSRLISNEARIGL